MIRLSDLNEAVVIDAEGKSLGRVHEVHVDCGEIRALTYGERAFIERMTGRGQARKIPWERVKQVAHRRVVLK